MSKEEIEYKLVTAYPSYAGRHEYCEGYFREGWVIVWVFHETEETRWLLKRTNI